MLGLSVALGIGNVAAQSGGGAPAGVTWDSGNSSADWVLSAANLTATRSGNSATWAMLRATSSKTTGTFAVTVNAIGASSGAQSGYPVIIGLDTGAETTYPGIEGSGGSIGYRADGVIVLGGGAATVTGATPTAYTTGDVIKVTKGTNTVSFFKNNTLQGTVDLTLLPVAGAAFPAASNGNLITPPQITLDASLWV